MPTPRGLSLLELVIAITLLAALAGLASVGVGAIRQGVAVQEASILLDTARLEARSSVADEAFGADVAEWSTRSVPIVAGAVDEEGTVSAYVPEPQVAVLAARGGSSCLVVVETLGETPRWGARSNASSCSAESMWQAQAQVTGTRTTPSEVV